KPENVILARDGRAVITDFGIARALADGEAGRTIGGIVGTPSYMAPEQVEGATDLDGRADLYALGTMLFELLSGKLAWPGDSIVAIATSRILRPPPDVRTHLPDLPEAAAALVLKLMARHRQDRFATAEEAGAAIAALVAADLPSSRSLPPAAPSSTLSMPTPPTVVHRQRRTVAVLPLINLATADDEYLVQTLTEDLVDLLSVVPELRVRPRGETARFAGRTRDVREAGRELDVDVVVDGSLRRIGDLVRVSLRLVTVEDGFQLWARRFDVAPASVLNVADDAASAVASALAAERTAEARPVASDPMAQELYLRGRYLLNRGWFEASREGVELLREAHERAPDDARIAGTYALAIARILTSDRDAEVAAAKARELAERTLERDPTQPEARVALGFLHINDSEGAAAAVQLKKALAVAPNSTEALDGIGRMLVEIGRPVAGIATLRRALAVDPLITHPRHSIARTYALLGEMDRAYEALGPVPTEPGDFVAYTMLKARFALWLGDRAAAQPLAETLAAATGLTVFARKALSELLRLVGLPSMDAATCAELDASLPVTLAFAPRRLAFHAQLRTELKLAGGKTEAGLSDLRAADSNGLFDLFWLDRCRIFDGVRSTPEFLRVRESTAARADRIAQILDPSGRSASLAPAAP
ncbi:MAG TPA: protein kinase, partial [Labilithrix sp.]|nr:protein kinase [Labilithrix sp.]